MITGESAEKVYDTDTKIANTLNLDSTTHETSVPPVTSNEEFLNGLKIDSVSKKAINLDGNSLIEGYLKNRK